MADYNIYIHSASISGQSNPTKPWATQDNGSGANSQTQGWGNKISQSIQKGAAIAGSPDSLIAMGISKAMKALPALAAAYIVVKLASQIYSNCIEVAAVHTGDYSQVVAHENFKAGLNVVFHPISTAFNSWKQRETWRIENQKRTMTRELLGDSVINSYTNRGI